MQRLSLEHAEKGGRRALEVALELLPLRAVAHEAERSPGNALEDVAAELRSNEGGRRREGRASEGVVVQRNSAAGFPNELAETAADRHASLFAAYFFLPVHSSPHCVRAEI